MHDWQNKQKFLLCSPHFVIYFAVVVAVFLGAPNFPKKSLQHKKYKKNGKEKGKKLSGKVNINERRRT